jgi:hypothetical protein
MFDIPVVINNFNRLTTTKKLADDLSNLGYTNIHILDNNSSYAPLLEWYGRCSYKVKRLDSNQEFLSLYNSGYINEFIKEPWVVYTDCDIELNKDTPNDFVGQIIRFTEKYNKSKGGLALKIDDLPDNPYAEHYGNWERRYWTKELEKDVYEADIDTTFCVIKPGQPFDYQALRVAGNMTARHVPWYTDFSNLDEEEKYYLETSSDGSSYKRFYQAYIKNQ